MPSNHIHQKVQRVNRTSRFKMECIIDVVVGFPIKRYPPPSNHENGISTKVRFVVRVRPARIDTPTPVQVSMRGVETSSHRIIGFSFCFFLVFCSVV